MCELKSSPIFNLSMASKELFHSNMLYWISTVYRLQFVCIMETLGVEVQDWPSNWKSHREKDHFDLSVTNEKEDKYLFILENKVKSIPYNEQLDKYKGKIQSQDTQWMLLSLATELPNENDIKKGWKIKNYQDLSVAIYKVLPTISDCYHRQLLEDYCACILLLHKKQSSWTFDDNCIYLDKFVKDSDEEKNLGIEDVRKKVLYSRLAAQLRDKLSAAKICTNKEIIDIAKGQNQPGDIYVNYGMTHGMGLIDIKIRINGNLLFVIQLQGAAYKHCIETLDVKSDDIKTIEAIGQHLENKNAGAIISDIIKKLIEKFFNSIEGQKNLASFPFKENEAELVNSMKKGGKKSSSAYNRYGESFIYQYVKIANNTKVNCVVEAIAKEVNEIKSILNNIQL